MHEGVHGPSAAHGRCEDRLGSLPTKPASRLCSWGNRRLRAIARKLAPLHPLDGDEGRRARAPGALGLLSRGGSFASPTPPSNRREAPQGLPPPLSRSRRRRSPVSPPRGRPGELASSHSAGDVRRCVLLSRLPREAARRACSSLAARRDLRGDGLEDLPVTLPVSPPAELEAAMQVPPGVLWRPSSIAWYSPRVY